MIVFLNMVSKCHQRRSDFKYDWLSSHNYSNVSGQILFLRGGSLAFYHHLQCFRAENCEMECRFVGLRVLVDEFKGGGSSPQ